MHHGTGDPVQRHRFHGCDAVGRSGRPARDACEHHRLKESGGDIGTLSAVVDQTPDEFSLLAGSAPAFYASLLCGAVGGVLAVACVVPHLCVELYGLVQSSRLPEARALQRTLTPLARLVTREHGVPGLKAALSLVGFTGGEPRRPLRPYRTAL